VTTPTLEKHWATLRRLAGNCDAYNGDANKKMFASASKSIAHWLREECSLGDADIRFNPGGIAVSGETTLHAGRVYVQFSGDYHGRSGVLVRSCKGRKDYTGGWNRYASAKGSLEDLARLVSEAAKDGGPK